MFGWTEHDSDRQTYMVVGWAEQCSSITLRQTDGQTAVAHQPTQKSRSGWVHPGGARLIPRKTDRQTDGAVPRSPRLARGSPVKSQPDQVEHG